MYTFRFRKFKVYQDSLNFRKKVKGVVGQHFPKSEQYSLSDQLLRATNSIILNIAEGSDRSTDKDFALFLNRSLTSLNEVVACLDIALLDAYITNQCHQELFSLATQLADQVTAFHKRLLTDNHR